jgi:hypothetical protein
MSGFAPVGYENRPLGGGFLGAAGILIELPAGQSGACHGDAPFHAASRVCSNVTTKFSVVDRA